MTSITMTRPLIEELETPAEGERELLLVRLIDAPAHALFRCWSEPALLDQWFAPKPWTAKVDSHDFRVGGQQQITMAGPDGEAFPSVGVYLEIVPDRKIVFTDAFSADWNPGAADPFMVGEVTFEPQPDGRTLYTARVRHWSVEKKAQHEAMGFRTGWGICAVQLAELAKTL